MTDEPALDNKSRNILIALLLSFLIIPPMLQGMMRADEVTPSSHSVQIMIVSSIHAYYNGTLTIEWNDDSDTTELESYSWQDPSPQIIIPFLELNQPLIYNLTYDPIDYLTMGPFTLNSMVEYSLQDPSKIITITIIPIPA